MHILLTYYICLTFIHNFATFEKQHLAAQRETAEGIGTLPVVSTSNWTTATCSSSTPAHSGKRNGKTRRGQIGKGNPRQGDKHNLHVDGNPVDQNSHPGLEQKARGKPKAKESGRIPKLGTPLPKEILSLCRLGPLAGASPFQSTAHSSTPASDLSDLSSMQEAASHLRLAYKDPDSRPPEVQSFIERADREANRSNIKSIHATTRGLDKAQKALQDAVTAKKEHRLLWTKHVSEGIKVWEAQLESYRVHQANLAEQAAKARAEITAARRNIQLLSDRSVTEGSAAIPQPIRAEAEDVTVDILDDPEEQNLRKQLQGVLNACASSLGISVEQAAEDKGVQEILSDNEEDKPTKRPRSVEPAVKSTPAVCVAPDTPPSVSSKSDSFSSSPSSQQYAALPHWAWRLFETHFSSIPQPPGDGDVSDDEPVDPISVLVWYVDHEDPNWCLHPRIAFLRPDDPTRWFDDIKFPWLHAIPFGERVFVDLVQPVPPRYRYETHVADLILTTRPIQVSALVSLWIQPDDDAADRILWRAAGTLQSVETLTHLQQVVPRCQQLLSQGYHLSAEGFPTLDQLIPIRNGQGILMQAALPELETGTVDSPAPDDLVLLDITNLPQKGRSTHKTTSSVGAPLSKNLAVLSSPTWYCEDSDRTLLDTFSMMQISNFKTSPHSDDQNAMLNAFQQGHTQPIDTQLVDDPSDIEPGSDESGYEPSIAQTPDESPDPETDKDLQEVFLYHLHDPPLRRFVHWQDYYTMIHDIARQFHQHFDNVVDAYELNVVLPDIPEGAAVALVHLLHDIPVGRQACLVLLDVELHGHKLEPHVQTGPFVQRSVFIAPTRVTRSGFLTLAHVDQYCRMESGRCLVFVNHVRWPDYDELPRDLHNGDHPTIMNARPINLYAMSSVATLMMRFLTTSLWTASKKATLPVP
eukprot:s2690_g9.t1